MIGDTQTEESEDSKSITQKKIYSPNYFFFHKIKLSYIEDA